MKTAFLFPGQGAQTVGMATALCESLPTAKLLFDRASAILGYDLLDICKSGPAERLNATDVSQPAIFVASMAGVEKLNQDEPDVKPDAVAGLSLGEYTALAYAGAISFDDGVRLVQARGQAMQAASVAKPGAMASVLGLDAAEVESLVAEARVAGVIEVANYLCPGNTVASGSVDAIAKLEEICESRGGIRTVPLAVSGAFHTVLMKPADNALAAALANVTFQTPAMPVWSNVDGQPHTDSKKFPELLVQQVVMPVRWEAILRGLLAQGMERFYEIGPNKYLSGIMKRVHRKADFRNVIV